MKPFWKKHPVLRRTALVVVVAIILPVQVVMKVASAAYYIVRSEFAYAKADAGKCW